MEASGGRSRVRPIVVDFLGTLFITFCIGVTTAVVLGACVVLMAGEARGAALGGELAPMKASEAGQDALLLKSDSAGETLAAPLEVNELALTHHLVTKYASLIAVDRTPARPSKTLTAPRRSCCVPRYPCAPAKRQVAITAAIY